MISRVLFICVFTIFLGSCGPTPCKCGSAAVYNDRDMIKECEKKVSQMTTSEQLEWNMKVVKCVNSMPR